MKKALHIFIAVLVVVCLYSPCVAMAASPCSNAYITSFEANISASGDGQIKINFGTWGTGTMSTIGASKIDIYNKDGLVFTFSMDNKLYANNMVGTNTVVFYGSVTYNGVPDESYHATVTHYASKDDGSGTETFTTKSVVA